MFLLFPVATLNNLEQIFNVIKRLYEGLITNIISLLRYNCINKKIPRNAKIACQSSLNDM